MTDICSGRGCIYVVVVYVVICCGYAWCILYCCWPVRRQVPKTLHDYYWQIRWGFYVTGEQKPNQTTTVVSACDPTISVYGQKSYRGRINTSTTTSTTTSHIKMRNQLYLLFCCHWAKSTHRPKSWCKEMMNQRFFRYRRPWQLKNAWPHCPFSQLVSGHRVSN